jgi:radical SAM protein with 4Fe4S-binding SPASM domain
MPRMRQHLSIRHVQVQTISWCNRGCAFCPSKKFPIERALMSLGCYERILDELTAFGFEGRFSPYLNNESLLDKRLVRLVALARMRLPASVRFIATNGDALTIDRAVALFDAGLDRITINCYDDRGDRIAHMRRLAQDLCARVAGLRRADDATFAEMVSTADGGSGRRIICVRDCTGLRVEDMSNIAGNVPDAAIPAAPLMLSCYRPFEQLHVRYNGDVVLCHCDWKGEVVFGNINEQSLSSIYDGAVARDYRERLARGDRRARLCSQCDFPGVLQ